MALSLALDTDGPSFRAVRGTSRRFFCTNASQDACNWLLPEGCGDSFCLACQHNGTVPDLSVQSNLTGWRELEAAKHRLMYSLLRWRLPLRTCTQDPEHGLIFNFLADTPALLVRDGGELEACRLHFCDDSRDYQSALEHHYRLAGTLCFGLSFGASMGGLRRDLGHYVHIVDTLEMAGNFGIQVAPAAGSSADFAAKIDFDPYTIDDFETRRGRLAAVLVCHEQCESGDRIEGPLSVRARAGGHREAQVHSSTGSKERRTVARLGRALFPHLDLHGPRSLRFPDRSFPHI